MTKEEKCNEDYIQQPSFIREHRLPFIEGWMAGYEKAQSEFKNLGIGDVSGSYPTVNDVWSIARTDDMMTFRKWYNKHFGNCR